MCDSYMDMKTIRNVYINRVMIKSKGRKEYEGQLKRVFVFIFLTAYK